MVISVCSHCVLFLSGEIWATWSGSQPPWVCPRCKVTSAASRVSDQPCVCSWRGDLQRLPLAGNVGRLLCATHLFVSPRSSPAPDSLPSTAPSHPPSLPTLPCFHLRRQPDATWNLTLLTGNTFFPLPLPYPLPSLLSLFPSLFNPLPFSSPHFSSSLPFSVSGT